MYGCEGIGWGWTNNDGYMSVIDYIPGMNIEVLIMGSSHMEAHQVMQENSAASLLNAYYGMTTYNVGISGHFFDVCASHLKAAVKKYKPSFTVIETHSVNFTEKAVNDILHYNVVPKDVIHDKGIASVMRKFTYLKLLYRQLPLMLQQPKKNTPEKPASREILSEMFAKLNEDVSLSGAKLIIAYHPSVSLNKDGTMKINDDPEVVRQFSELCAENGIYFLNMAGRFLEEYEKDYTLPYGFANTSVGKGHMNVYGHRMFADEIYRLIQRIGAGS